SSRPGLLYNIGVAADLLRRDREALEALEQFLAVAEEDSPHRPDAEARVEILRRTVVSEPVEPTPEPAATASAGDPTAGWIVFGASALVLATGEIMLGIGQADADRVESAPAGTPWVDVA